MSYTAVVEQIATTLRAEMTIGSTHGLPPATPTVDSAIVVPASDWGTFDGTTFCDADVSFEIILVAPTADYPSAFGWFHDRLAELLDAFSADPTLGGLVDGCIPMGWQQPQRLAIGTPRDALAVYVQLAPMRIN